jgi:hypothetical protein
VEVLPMNYHTERALIATGRHIMAVGDMVAVEAVLWEYDQADDITFYRSGPSGVICLPYGTPRPIRLRLWTFLKARFEGYPDVRFSG